MQSKRTKEILKELAYEFKMSEKEIYDIVKSPFDLVIEVMRAGDRDTVTFPSIRIIGFGTFYMTAKRKEYFTNLNARINARREEELEVSTGGCGLDSSGDKT